MPGQLNFYTSNPEAAGTNKNNYLLNKELARGAGNGTNIELTPYNPPETISTSNIVVRKYTNLIPYGQVITTSSSGSAENFNVSSGKVYIHNTVNGATYVVFTNGIQLFGEESHVFSISSDVEGNRTRYQKIFVRAEGSIFSNVTLRFESYLTANNISRAMETWHDFYVADPNPTNAPTTSTWSSSLGSPNPYTIEPGIVSNDFSGTTKYLAEFWVRAKFPKKGTTGGEFLTVENYRNVKLVAQVTERSTN